MKRIISLLLILTLIFTLYASVSVSAVEASPFSIKIEGRIDTAVKFAGQDTFGISWLLKSNEPNLTLNNTQGIRLAYDNTVLQLIHFDGSEAYLDDTINATLEPMTGACVLGDFETATMRVYAAKNVSGDTGFLSLTLGNDESFFPCGQNVDISLLRVRFAFRSGKSISDLNADSIRLMTVSELNATNQSCGVLINACANDNPDVLFSYEFLRQVGGVQIPGDDLLPPVVTLFIDDSVLTFTVESKKARAGEYIEVPIIITNNPGIASITRLQISWDSDKLMYDDRLGVYNPATTSSARQTWPFTIPAVYADGGIFEGAPFTPPAEGTAKTASYIRFNFATIANSTENGILLTLKFKVKGDVEPGEIDLTLSLEVVENERFVEVPFSLVDGAIIVHKIVYGDVNNDGRITASDVTMLLQYLAEWDLGDAINLANADVNGDGRITASDVTLLLQYLAEWDVVLGPQI